MKKITSKQYNPKEFEPIWQSKWEKDGIYHTNLKTANGSAGSPRGRFYNLMMFPYPSAEGLHIGGMRTFVGVDIYGRFKRMKGFDVFEPFGLDGFGIHAENYALKIGKNPMDHAKVTENNFYRQIKEAAIGVDWDRTVETYKPEYYKWTQWIFAELFKSGLATRKKSPVNFCPSCKTVLADEQVIDGKCERCSSVVEKKNLEQWFFRITEYADRLLNNIPGLDWTEKVKIAQKNWIGRKEGIEISYGVEGLDEEIVVFTTRPDTNFGATFIALAPEHEFVAKLLDKELKTENLEKIKEYVEATKKKTDIERQAEGKEKSGVFTGLYVVNQLTGYKMPVWVSDFVLMGFGTGAVVGVPGHDRRDFEFAVKFGLEIIRVVVGKDGDKSEITELAQVQEEEGILINSDFLNGLDIHTATVKIMDYLEEKRFGKRKVTYHLRDWLISRQRYWGPPIPMIYCESCATKGDSWFTSDEARNQQELRIKNKELRSIGKLDPPAGGGNSSEAMAGWYPEENLPVKLPYIKDFKPLGTGNSPLGNHPEFYEVKCPSCGSDARRETDVSDTFLDSSWYFLRYLATDRDDIPFPSVELARSKKQEARSKEEIRNLELEIGNSSQRLAWLPVTMYIGGAEHSVLHLLYARFITMFLKDKGLIEFEEPFKRFYAHGLIIKDGAKMSKSKGNVVGPDVYIKKYGADTLRTYLHFLAPFGQDGDFRDSGVEGMNKFLKRVWKLLSEVVSADKSLNHAEQKRQITQKGSVVPREVSRSSAALRMMHGTIQKVTEEMEALRFNTAIAHLMTWYNFLSKQAQISTEEAEVYLKLLAPFAPHMTEELFAMIHTDSEQMTTDPRKSVGNQLKSIHTSSWPEFDEKYLVADIVKIAVQVNGKLRGVIQVGSSDIDNKSKIEELAKNDEKVAIFLADKTIKKFIYVPGKVVNFVL